MSIKHRQTPNNRVFFTRKRLFFALSVLAILAVMAILSITTRMRHYGKPTLPEVGAAYVYKMLVVIDDKVRTPRLRVRCTKAVGEHRTLEVSYLMKDGQLADAPWDTESPSAMIHSKYGQWKPVYLVHIRYDTDDLSKRVVVQDMTGKVIPRGQTVHGLPIPFHSFLFFPGSRLTPPKVQYPLSDGWEVTNRSNSSFVRTGMSILISFTLYKDFPDKKPIGYLEYDEWYPDEWLWRKVLRESDTPGDPRFELIRLDPPEQNNNDIKND
ncbi:MAG TPA: hypothetical protein PKV43_06810 [Armatimonadota bacterium]|nr:hypothetical protein [Armatimonadota bacterium]